MPVLRIIMGCLILEIRLAPGKNKGKLKVIEHRNWDPRTNYWEVMVNF